MVPKFHPRTIGSVNVFEIAGVYAEPWVNRIKDEMELQLEEAPLRGLLFNLRDVERLDHPGAEAILKTIRKREKRAILGRNLSAYYVAEHMRPEEPITMFEKEREAVGYFGREFAQPMGEVVGERRKYPRVKTALPAEFEVEKDGVPFVFEMVVTNLSEGGLYGHFLDSRTEELVQRTLDPYELRLLKIRLWLPEEKAITADGKVVRLEKEAAESSGTALEFYHLNPDERTKLSAFLHLNAEEGK